MLVELDAFSGRPNPSWRLSDTEAAEFARLIAGLAPASGGSSPHLPGLGYRGFQLESAAGAYRVYGELVQPASSVVLADPDRHVERFLVAHLPAALHDLRAWLEAEIALRIKTPP
jgi:hypothetical protein